MTTSEIRKKFLDFFASKKHTVIDSDSLVPKDDPTVLFTTAGMQQFKKQFLGETTGFTRAATAQKCLRTDDLPQVGMTAFHHTFFEMLGNFSFGDYFKNDAILWAWEFLTKEIGLSVEKLWVSVYKDDREAEEIWLKTIKINPQKLVRLGDKSNFWPSQAKDKGPNGPCGPCSEIFFDYGTTVGCGKPGCTPACDCGRFAEIWNLVFTQFNRKDGGILEPLPNKNIDTGMGLERLAAVVQGQSSNFGIDLFAPIFAAIDRESQKARITLSPKENRVLADHMRAIVFGIADGVIPSNEGRGYVVKKLIADTTDILLQKSDHSFIHKLVPAVVVAMKDPYEDLAAKEKNIMAWVQKTEEAYQKVRAQRLPEFKKEAARAKDHVQHLGEIIFRYRDTFGVSLSAASATVSSLGLTASQVQSAFAVADQLMDEQRERSRAASKMTGDVFVAQELSLDVPKTEFVGYRETGAKAKVLKIFVGTEVVSKAQEGQAIKVVLSRTPFYAESGGQVADTGEISTDKAVMAVTHTQKISDVFVHNAEVKKGSFTTGETVTAAIDVRRRLNIMRHHTATHLLQAALREVLGSHVQQQGSLVAEDRLRFDFTHPKGLSRDEIFRIEEIVNRHVFACEPVDKKEFSLAEAQKQGALAFFAEKYASRVTVVTMSGFSKELCGGTHLDNTGKVGLFKIIGESAIAQGIRRIEAVTGDFALQAVQDTEKQLGRLAELLKVPAAELNERFSALLKRTKDMEKTLGEAQFEKIRSSVDELICGAKTVKGIKVLIKIFPNMDIETLKRLSDLVRQKATTVVMGLGTTTNDAAAVLVCVTDDLLNKGLKANEIVQAIAPVMNGSGGGRPQMAQAGGKDPAKLSAALDKIIDIVSERA